MKPKLVIDTISLLSSLTGIGRYTYEIAKSLKTDDTFELYFFYGYHSQILSTSLDSREIKKFKSFIVKIPLLKKIARKILNISSVLFSPIYDLYWQPSLIPLKGIKAKKTITSVHDFSFILHKDFHPKERIEYFENNFFKNIYRSHMIITGSHYSKTEILQRLQFSEDKVKVIYHGIDHSIFKIYDKFDLPFKLPKKFIFSVGSIEPRKNLLGLLRAYNDLSEQIRAEYKLVLAGFKGWENKEIMQLITKNEQNIHYLGFIDDSELAKVYNLASLFVFPSFYEGFGLPPLEAMACGTPVVSSNLTSMPEVCQDAAIYCDPYNIVDIKQKIELVLGDEVLQKKLISKGLKRASEFSWQKSAQMHLAVFKEVMES
ncbi:MAG: glycosyltransferase family 1 protein [Thiovulaceae bacterium]|nr:glycosyltransferase family 1 protein [Sulfurimonadaceae bacterium]